MSKLAGEGRVTQPGSWLAVLEQASRTDRGRSPLARCQVSWGAIVRHLKPTLALVGPIRSAGSLTRHNHFPQRALAQIFLMERPSQLAGAGALMLGAGAEMVVTNGTGFDIDIPSGTTFTLFADSVFTANAV